VLWLPRQAATPVALINGLSQRGARLVLLHDDHAVMADLLEQGAAAVIIHEQVDAEAAGQLVEAVRQFVPRTLFRVFAPTPPPGALHHLRAELAPRVTPEAAGDGPSCAQAVTMAVEVAEADDAAALVDGPWPLRPPRQESRSQNGGITSLLIRLADQAREGKAVTPPPSNGHEPLLSREELAMLLGPREDQADEGSDVKGAPLP
jgi:hypothetical protein